MKESTAKWLEEMAFDIEVDGHHFTIDAEEKFGGKDRGPRPKDLMLSSLVGCTGMDVIAILNKMRVKVESFSVSAKGKLRDEHPKIFTDIHIIYKFVGENLPMDKLEKAVNLSQERYCGVSAMLRAVANLTHEIVVEKSVNVKD